MWLAPLLAGTGSNKVSGVAKKYLMMKNNKLVANDDMAAMNTLELWKSKAHDPPLLVALRKSSEAGTLDGRLKRGATLSQS